MRVEPGQFWTPNEIAYLRANWGKMSSAAIGRVLMRRKDAVNNKAHRMKLPSLPSPIIVRTEPVVTTSRALLGGGALPAGHPLTWGLLVAHTPSISSRWPG